METDPLLRVSLDASASLQGYQALVPAWAPTERHGHGKSIVGRCNATHSVLYSSSSDSHAHLGMDIFVRPVRPEDPTPPAIPREHANRINLILFVEPPAMYDFTRAVGYSGLVANTREAAVWRPLVPPEQVRRAIDALAYQPKRDTIGIWLDNCYPHTR